MAVFACIWSAIGIDLGWLFLVMGLLIGGAVFPAAFTVTWEKQSKWGAMAGALGGLAAGLIGWLTVRGSFRNFRLMRLLVKNGARITLTHPCSFDI